MPVVPLQDKWQPLLSTVTGVHRYKWLKQSVQGLAPQSALLGTIAEFALREEPVDVEKMRKCLLKQVTSCRERPPSHAQGLPHSPWRHSLRHAVLQLERAEVRLEGIDTILKLAAKSFLLPSVQYAMFCGWQRLIPEGVDLGYHCSLCSCGG